MWFWLQCGMFLPASLVKHKLDPAPLTQIKFAYLLLRSKIIENGLKHTYFNPRDLN